MAEIFGFEIKRLKRGDEKLQSIVPPTDEDGSGYVTAAGTHYGTYVNIAGNNESKDNYNLLRQYRQVALHPEVDMAIQEIVNEAIVTSENESAVELI